MRKYPEALALAKENYEEKRNNAFHIEAYFKCLIRKPNLTSEDSSTLNKLINSMEISYDAKKEEIKATMLAEKKYFIDNNVSGAINDLQDIIKTSMFKTYAVKSLCDIYMKESMPDKATVLQSNYADLLNDFE